MMLVFLGEIYKIKKIKSLIIKNKKVFVILLGVIFLVLFVFFIKSMFNHENKEESSFYYFSDERVEIEGTKKHSSDKLSAPHCLKNICISEVIFSYSDNNYYGLNYVIKNNSSKEASGYFYMNYGEEKILIAYSSLEPGKSKRLSSSVQGKHFEINEDYTLSELTPQELENIHTSN